MALNSAGVDVHPPEAGRSELGGILLVSRPVDEQLNELLHRTRGGLDRVLVIVTDTDTHEGVDRDYWWHILAAGACDVIVWDGPWTTAQAVAQRLERWRETDRLVESPAVQNNLVGRSRTWITLLREIVEVSRFTSASILITGESGTGKELLARLVHTLDPRPNKSELIVLDCTTVVPELAGSEFFGHERGSYTGAVGPREGAFALADGGTLFLDEIGDLALPLQAQLLRAVQEKAYKRVGGNAWQTTEFRLVSATNRQLSSEVEQGRFRRDLYYRLATWVCHVPPLRDRPEDILPLVEHFLSMSRPGRPYVLDEAVRDYLVRRDYPGNVRDLRQLVGRICARHIGDGPISVGSIPSNDRPSVPFDGDWRTGSFEQGVRRALATGVGLRDIGRGAEEMAVDIAVGEEGGNLQRAARRLGVTDRALQMRRVEQKRQVSGS